jgi:hypothetical protein
VGGLFARPRPQISVAKPLVERVWTEQEVKEDLKKG